MLKGGDGKARFASQEASPEEEEEEAKKHVSFLRQDVKAKGIRSRSQPPQKEEEDTVPPTKAQRCWERIQHEYHIPEPSPEEEKGMPPPPVVTSKS